MANKRELKKFVRNTCGALAAEILLARAAFPEIERQKVHDIIGEIAVLQSDTLSKATLAFAGKADKNAEGAKAKYRAEKSAYYHAAYARLLEEFDTSVREIVKHMNAALPEGVRLKIKEVANA
ncbi:MAG: hypothetical protein K2F79_04315 [Muribaculaceae bacterium]|nr:hypothetical protein [Muribaculaceae bacterium]